MPTIINRAHSFVTRWHHRPDMGQRETLAEHMGWVARIAMLLANEYTFWSEKSDKEVDWKLLYEMALQHDDAEIITGDIPSPAKKLFNGKVDEVEKSLVHELYIDYPNGNYRATFLNSFGNSLEARLVHAADKIAGLAYGVMQIWMGNAYFKALVIFETQRCVELLKEIKGMDVFIKELEALQV